MAVVCKPTDFPEPFVKRFALGCNGGFRVMGTGPEHRIVRDSRGYDDALHAVFQSQVAAIAGGAVVVSDRAGRPVWDR